MNTPIPEEVKKLLERLTDVYESRPGSAERSHLVSCPYPEGCSCGTVVYNRMARYITEINATLPLLLSLASQSLTATQRAEWAEQRLAANTVDEQKYKALQDVLEAATQRADALAEECEALKATNERVNNWATEWNQKFTSLQDENGRLREALTWYAGARSPESRLADNGERAEAALTPPSDATEAQSAVKVEEQAIRIVKRLAQELRRMANSESLVRIASLLSEAAGRVETILNQVPPTPPQEQKTEDGLCLCGSGHKVGECWLYASCTDAAKKKGHKFS